MPKLENFLKNAESFGYNLEIAKILFKGRFCKILMQSEFRITQFVLGLKFNK